jgi:tetratricopeptide (TPR) repeat protein
MTSTSRDRIARELNRAEGFLLLDLPHRSLEILHARSEWPEHLFEASFLTGEALRALGRFREALKPLETAASLQPENIGVAVSLGWCYKRTHRLAQAIDALERAKRANPDEALLHYNLACYWSLAGDRTRAIESLLRAVELEPELQRKLSHEPDFDAIRNEPQFELLVVGKTPQV